MVKRLPVLVVCACIFLVARAANAQTLDDQQSAFLTLINNYRAQNGVGPLQVSATLQQSSQWMSNDMATKNYFSHTDSLGRDPFTRMAAFGYSYYPEGENVAAGNSAAQNTFDQFQSACDPDSSGNCTYAHRQNMLDASYAAIGIGRAYSSTSTYGWYWTNDFGAVLDQPLSGGTPPPSSVPTIATFTSSPSNLTAGQSTTLSWSVTGATTVSISSGVGNVPSTGSVSVSPSQTITYTLTATNNSGSSTAQSTVTVSALPPPKGTGPTAPVLTSATAISGTEVDLAWTASTSSLGIASYQIVRNSGLLATVSGSALTYADTSVSAGQIYNYFVQAVDSAGNTSPASNSMQVTIPATPVSPTACSAPATGAFTGCYYSNITLSGTPSVVRTDAQINFDWGLNAPARSISRGNFSVRWQGNFTFAQGTYTFSAITSDGMRLYIDGNIVLNQWENQPPITYTVQQTLSQGTHLITVEYYEQSGTASAHLSWLAATPAAPLPVISSFTATPSTITAGKPSTLSWTVSGASSISIDNGVGTLSGVTSQIVAPLQTTTYTLKATNSTGASTAQVTVTVTAAPDTQPPTTPVLTSAVPKSSTEADLTWSASTDNVAVAGYQVLRNGLALTSVSPASLSYADTTVSPGVSYTYAVKAYDAAGNYSSASNSMSVTVPSAPASNTSCPTVAVGAFTGCYYPNVTLSGTPTLVRTDAQINFDWGSSVPDRSLPRGGFSVQWQGTFTFTAGAHTFTALTSDGMRLYIDGNVVMDHWVNESAMQYSVTQTLGTGTHAITVEYYEETGSSTAHVTWN